MRIVERTGAQAKYGENKMKPFSDNIIFWDTEFSSLDPYKGELLSIGLVRINGEGLYLELEPKAEIDPWVKANVLPYLTGPKVDPKKAIQLIHDFIGESKPYSIAYVNQYDSVYLYKILKSMRLDNPFHWLPIDFASILFGMGFDPESYYFNDKNNFFKKIGVDATKYREHHALDDAKLLREVYLKLLKE